MKNTVVLLAVLFGMFQFVGAQNTEGHISYKVEVSSDNPEIQPMLGMMNGSTLDLYFSDMNSRTEMKMGSIANTTTIMDLNTKKMLTLTSGMMGRNAIQGTIPEPDESDKKGEEEDNFKIRLTSETKQIIGLNAKKAIVTVDNGKEFDFWYTDDIGTNLKGQAMIQKSGIPGVLLEMVIDQGPMKLNFTATAYEKKLPKKNQLFSMEVPEGYTVREGEDMLKMMQGFGQ